MHPGAKRNKQFILKEYKMYNNRNTDSRINTVASNRL